MASRESCSPLQAELVGELLTPQNVEAPGGQHILAGSNPARLIMIEYIKTWFHCLIHLHQFAWIQFKGFKKVYYCATCHKNYREEMLNKWIESLR